MKSKKILTLSIIFLLLSLFLQACEKEQEKYEEFDQTKIKYVVKKREEFKNSDQKEKFEEIYGQGKFSDAIRLKDALGNLVAMEFYDYNVGISLRKSQVANDAFSPYFDYYKKDDLAYEKENTREFGPIYFKDPNVISNISFDKVFLEDKELLLVSLSLISLDEQYSSFYFFNKDFLLEDYISFTNSTANIYPRVDYENESYKANSYKEGSLLSAIKERVKKEDELLIDLFEKYGIESRDVYQKIGGEKVKVSNFPKDTGKVQRILSIESVTNKEEEDFSYQYFKIY